MTSGFSFLNKGNKTLKVKELKESKGDEDVEILEKIFEGTDDEELITASKLPQMCEVTKYSPKPLHSKDLSLQMWKTPAEPDSAAKEPRPTSFGRRKGVLLRSVSEVCELHPEFSGDEATKEYNSSPDIRRTAHDKDRMELDSEKSKAKTSHLARLKTSTDEPKIRTSVIDKLNERVFYGV